MCCQLFDALGLSICKRLTQASQLFGIDSYFLSVKAVHKTILTSCEWYASAAPLTKRLETRPLDHALYSQTHF